ncbi:lactosylceramide alpha-2,3-sialyltransferase isoform X1 [Callorhinchus milii]|uniref:lactosylceramide alpha-2,3-sialyltransferase isoform X1 n=1 Tax=Callorhinchus milii TaxID=7868 RepID=UPI000457286E|nr:lactosylceramide alpha-2,3-sialyltransferase isoform X1 [Callorhinchus milii]|eukprot:gi/632960407/ref/XP_007896178.1/ PREDICTED: lactosylceramide alpha-2,3-sialyltransferase [Callorhinchus milii]
MAKAGFIVKGILRLVGLMMVCLGVLAIFHRFLNQHNPKDDIWNSYVVDPEKIKDAQEYAEKVLGEKCRLSFAHQKMAILFPHKYDLNLSPFLKRNSGLTGNVFKYHPPFGFKKHNLTFSELIGLLPKVSLSEELERKPCKRCVILGSGGILRGLGLGPYLNTFDVVIRLNSAPIHGFTQDVGNKTTIRMSYPEGTPKSLHDYDPHMLFVAVMYKGVDFSWLKAMVKKEEVPFFDSLWFWKAVPRKLPIEPEQFRILNPEIIRETAIDLLQLPEPRWKLWRWDQNIPTLGVSAVVLATHLCDEVSLAGFGYNLGEPDTPLHYYENVRMEAMKAQTMHNVETERKFLAGLVEKGVVTDLSGGIHCKFCKSKS